MKFKYKGRDREGVIMDGLIEAPTKEEAIGLLRDNGVGVVALESRKGFSLKMDITIFKRVKLSERIMFTKNLSGMLRAGLPISRALVVLTKQSPNAYFKSIITDLIETIDKGGSFSEGLAHHPKVFSSLFVAMVRAGEESGSLPNSLMEVGGNLEKSYALNRKIKGAMMYPSIIVAAIFIIGILMFIYVVPTLTKTFKEMGAQLPTSTKIVVGLSDAISNHLLLLVLGIATLVIGGYFAFKLPQTKKFIDFISVRLPAIGPLIKEVNSARTARTLSSLLVSGVNISRAISITEEVLQNVYYKKVMVEVERVIQKGAPMSEVFKAHTKLYPVMVGEMIEVGEETGKLSSMLLDIATFYEGEVDAKTKNLSTIIEPVLMIFIGAAVGFFAISMLSPMYSIMDTIQ